ncbi:MAG: ClpP family protease [Mycobacteriaceae bacterium]
MAAKDDLKLELLQAQVRAASASALKDELEAVAIQRDNTDILSGAYYHRVYTFIGAVRGDTVHSCMSTLGKWSRAEPGCGITIVFNSPGGSVIDGLALYDHLIELRQLGHRITTVARGMAASMGGILLQAGDERIVGPNAHVLIHEISSGAVGKFSEIEDEIAFLKKLQDHCVNILAERSTLTARQIKSKWRKTDWWLGADEAVKFGFADRIG